MGTDVGLDVDKGEGYVAAAPGESSEGKGPPYEGTPDSTLVGTPDARPASMGAERRPDHHPSAWTPASREPASGMRPELEPAHQAAGTTEGNYSPRSVAGRGAGHVGVEDTLPAHPPDRRAVESLQTVDAGSGRDGGFATPAVQSGGGQRPAGDQAQLASATPFWSTKFLLDPVWDDGGFLVQQTQEMFRSLGGGARNLSAGMPGGGNLTQRGPPLRVPSPFSGFGLVIGSSATGYGSSDDSIVPLLAVIVSYLFAIMSKDRSRAYRAFLRPGTVPRLALERPG